MIAGPAPLSAPLDVGFDYTRSLGATLGRFLTGLRNGHILGVRGSDGRILVPPAEYDPVTAAALTEFVEVAAEGTVQTWSWAPESPGHTVDREPLPRPFAWALIRLDGADTALLHAVDAGHPERMHSGLRVRVRWAPDRVGRIQDIACFEPIPDDTPKPVTPQPVRATETATESTPEPNVEPVTMVRTPIHLHYTHTASAEESRYLRGLAEGRLLGQRCPVCRKVYLPPRGACPTDGVPTTDEVELPDRGTVTTFCVVNVPFQGQRLKPPYVAAYVLLDGADIGFQHLILGCAPDEVRMGLRVEAVWRPRSEWGPSLENIDHFRPSGEPDAPYESYAQHL